VCVTYRSCKNWILGGDDDKLDQWLVMSLMKLVEWAHMSGSFCGYEAMAASAWAISRLILEEPQFFSSKYFHVMLYRFLIRRWPFDHLWTALESGRVAGTCWVYSTHGRSEPHYLASESIQGAGSVNCECCWSCVLKASRGQGTRNPPGGFDKVAIYPA
jgi:hypothetical protein